MNSGSVIGTYHGTEPGVGLYFNITAEIYGERRAITARDFY